MLEGKGIRAVHGPTFRRGVAYIESICSNRLASSK